MGYRVEVSARAFEEAQQAYLCIRARSPRNAARWYWRLFDVIDGLEHSPRAHPWARESTFFDEDIRQVTHGVYRILFTVRSHTVHVLHIRHGARRRLGEPPDDEGT